MVVLTKDRLLFLRMFVEHLFANTRVPLNVFFVDNASSTEVLGYLRSLSPPGHIKTKVIQCKKNYGHQSWTKGFALVKSNPFVISDPDCLVQPYEGKCWLERMLDLMKKYPEMGQIGCNFMEHNCHEYDASIHRDKKCAHFRWAPHGEDEEIRLRAVATTTLLMRHGYRNFRAGGVGIRTGLKLSGMARDIYVNHIGWEEYKYPDLAGYVLEKITKLRVGGHKGIIERMRKEKKERA